MSAESLLVDQRHGRRVVVDAAAELLADDGTPHPAVLVNLSHGGGQLELSAHAAAALHLRDARQARFRFWLDDEASALPLHGEATVRYCIPHGAAVRVGLDFDDLAVAARRRIEETIAALRRYEE